MTTYGQTVQLQKIISMVSDIKTCMSGEMSTTQGSVDCVTFLEIVEVKKVNIGGFNNT